MKIDTDKLSESEQIDLNRRIIERIRFLQQARAHKSMLRFSVRDKVCFEPEGKPLVLGVIKRYNKKTVSVLVEDGRNWRVSPQFILKVKDIPEPGSAKGNVIPIKGK